MLTLDHGFEHFVERGGHRDGNNLPARFHDFTDVKVIQIEHAVNHVFLQFGEVSGEAAGTDDQFEFSQRCILRPDGWLSRREFW